MALDEAVLVDGGAPERRVFIAESAIFRRKSLSTDTRRRKKKLRRRLGGARQPRDISASCAGPIFRGDIQRNLNTDLQR